MGFIGTVAENQLAFAFKVLDEDCFMRENQLPKEEPLNPTRGDREVIIIPGD